MDSITCNQFVPSLSCFISILLSCVLNFGGENLPVVRITLERRKIEPVSPKFTSVQTLKETSSGLLIFLSTLFLTQREIAGELFFQHKMNSYDCVCIRCDMSQTYDFIVTSYYFVNFSLDNYVASVNYDQNANCPFIAKSSSHH